MESVISRGLACNYREQLQQEINNVAQGLPLSRAGAAGAAKKIASLRRRNATLLGWMRDADAKKIDALEIAMQHICGNITAAVETVGESVAAVAESVAIVADSVAAVHGDLRSLMRGEVVLDEAASLDEQSAACDLALTILRTRKKKIAEMKKEQKLQVKAATPRAKRICKTVLPNVPPVVEEPAPLVKDAAPPVVEEPVPLVKDAAPQVVDEHAPFVKDINQSWEYKFEQDVKNELETPPLERLSREDLRRRFLNRLLKQPISDKEKVDVKFALHEVDSRRQFIMSQLPTHDRIEYIENLK
jgi:hypothetical protein